MSQKAVIYIRTSSEAQGEKASPSEQGSDYRHVAKENGLTVVRVYRDVKKYRVKNKLVEPSGSRVERPDLLAELQDASRGEFDVILAWREDRLYRGLRSMLMVLEAVDLHKIPILLVKETFDLQIVPIRARAAQMELESMQERMTMGVIARLKAGKANTGTGSLRVCPYWRTDPCFGGRSGMGASNLRMVHSENSPDANSKTLDRRQCSTKREQHSPTHPMVPF